MNLYRKKILQTQRLVLSYDMTLLINKISRSLGRGHMIKI